MDDEWIVVGLASCKIHVFSRRTGVLSRTLVGCQGGVWAVWLVGSGGIPLPKDDYDREDECLPDPTTEDFGGEGRRQTRGNAYDVSSSSDGWGQPHALVVSGGCDKVVRVWDVSSGHATVCFTGDYELTACLDSAFTSCKVTHLRSVVSRSLTTDLSPYRVLGTAH